MGIMNGEHAKRGRCQEDTLLQLLKRLDPALVKKWAPTGFRVYPRGRHAMVPVA